MRHLGNTEFFHALCFEVTAPELRAIPIAGTWERALLSSKMEGATQRNAIQIRLAVFAWATGTNTSTIGSEGVTGFPIRTRGVPIPTVLDRRCVQGLPGLRVSDIPLPTCPIQGVTRLGLSAL